MVQVINTENPQGKLSEMLGMSLGQGLGNGLNTFFANRSLESVMKDKSLENAPQSQKLEAIRSALSPYGEKGQEIFKQRMEIEQQEQKEKQEKTNLQKGDILRRRLEGKPVSEKEKGMFTPQEELAIAQHHQAIELQNLKNQGAKPTQASQPINPDQLNKIKDVRQTPEYEAASPSKKYRMLTDNGVSKENAEAESKIYAEEEKNKPGGEFSKLREKTVADLVSKAFEKRSEAEDLKYNFDTARKAINGDIQEPGIMAAIKNDPWGQLYLGLTPDEATLQAANKKLLSGTKGIFGNKPTEREIFLLLNSMLPSIGKTKEANLAGLDVIEKANDLAILHSDLIDQITDGGSKYVPNLEHQVNERMKPIIGKFRDELELANKTYNSPSQGNKNDSNNQKIKVKAPNGSVGFMTQEQIDSAKDKNVIFTPVQ
jgi:hypothetical protein